MLSFTVLRKAAAGLGERMVFWESILKFSRV